MFLVHIGRQLMNHLISNCLVTRSTSEVRQSITPSKISQREQIQISYQNKNCRNIKQVIIRYHQARKEIKNACINVIQA